MTKLVLHFDEDVKKEIAKLNRYEDTCINALKDLPDNDKTELTSLLQRMFVAEREYLIDSPEMYFELYRNKP